MDYAIKERIGKPDLFTERNDTLAFFLKWINDSKREKSQGAAIPARRKMGQTSITERLLKGVKMETSEMRTSNGGRKCLQIQS